MACNCKDITPQSKECYEQMITIEIPDHMSTYRNNRVEAGFSSKVSIDPCIFVEIWQLWQKGIITYGCCCGHNGKNPSFVNVDESNIQQMLDMGYLPNHQDLQRMDTFALKSAGGHYANTEKSNCTIFDVSESLPSDDEIKLTDNGFGALEDAVKKAKSNVR